MMIQPHADGRRSTISEQAQLAAYGTKTTALYERLGVTQDDQLTDDINSIAHQKRQLVAYADAHGFTNIVHFADEGVSGIRPGFERTGFRMMMDEICNGSIGACLCTSLSRLGRDYRSLSACIQLMKDNGVRLIAINDGLDTADCDNVSAFITGVLAQSYGW